MTTDPRSVERVRGVDDLTVQDLPIGRCTVEISAPPERLEPVPADAAGALTLITLHGQAMGVVLLQFDGDHAFSAHRDAVFAAVSDRIAAHLNADGLAAEPVAPWAPSLPCAALTRRVLDAPPPATVVVATRDRTDSLRTCLHALLQVAYRDIDIVVVDNAPSSDATKTMVQSEFDGIVRYVRENRPGLAAAHNRGLAEVVGDVVAFIDDDVVVDPRWLLRLVEAFMAAPDVACVTGLIEPAEIVTEAQLELERHGGFAKGFDLLIHGLPGNPSADPLFPFTAGRFGSGANMAFRTATLRDMGGFDPALGVGTPARGGDDLASFFRVIARGHQLVYQPSAVAWHRHHRTPDAVPRQVEGYAVGLGAYLTSALLSEPHTIPVFLRRLPGGVRFALRRRAVGAGGRTLPADLVAVERRGLLRGPLAYARSRRAGARLRRRLRAGSR